MSNIIIDYITSPTLDYLKRKHQLNKYQFKINVLFALGLAQFNKKTIYDKKLKNTLNNYTKLLKQVEKGKELNKTMQVYLKAFKTGLNPNIAYINARQYEFYNVITLPSLFAIKKMLKLNYLQLYHHLAYHLGLVKNQGFEIKNDKLNKLCKKLENPQSNYYKVLAESFEMKDF